MDSLWTVFIYYHLSESLLLGVYPEHLRMSCVLLNSAFFLTFCVYPSYFSFHNASRQLSFTFLCLLSTLFHGYGGIRELKELSISVLVFCLLLFSPCVSWLCKTWILAFSWTIAARPYKFCMVIASICVMVTTCILRNFILFSHLCVISCPGKNHIFKSDIYIKQSFSSASCSHTNLVTLNHFHGEEVWKLSCFFFCFCLFFVLNVGHLSICFTSLRKKDIWAVQHFML